MKQHIAHATLLVDNYDKAIAFYTQTLGFDLLEDTPLTDTKRWVLVAPKGSSGFSLLLAKADSSAQQSATGNQAGGRVFLFLYTDDFYRDYNNMVAKGVRIIREPVKEAYGTVAVFADIYGNLWDLLEPAKQL